MEACDPVNYFETATAPIGGVKTAYAVRELEWSAKDAMLGDLVRDYGPTASTIAAFDHWLTVVLPQQIACKSSSDELGVYVFENVRVEKPVLPNGKPLFPCVARRRGLTYSGKVLADVRRVLHSDTSPNSGKVINHGCELLEIVVMLGSVACHLRGLTPEEKRAVYEDEDDPFGYFIVKGGERIVMIQDGIAFSQQITKEYKGIPVTSVTTNRVSGTTVVQVQMGSTWPTMQIVIYQSGMKGTTSRPEYPVFCLFDVMMQFSDESLAYEDSTLPEGTKISRAEIERRREAIVTKALRLISQFVPPEHYSTVFHYLTASRAEYTMIPHPVVYAVTTRSHPNAIRNVTKAALTIIARRAASSLVIERARLDALKLANAPQSEISKAEAECVKAALDARDAAAAAAAENAGAEISAGDRCRIIMREFFTDVFPGVSLADKAVHLARIVAQQCLVGTGVRPTEDLDSWGNRRIKLPADWVAQLFNGHFKIPHSLGACISVNAPQITAQFVGSFAMGGKSLRENVVHVAKRDTPISLFAQVGRLNTPVLRKSKQSPIRLVHPTHTGTVCTAETPGGDACGLTKNLACTVLVSRRRNVVEFVSEVLTPLLSEWYGDASTFDPERPNAVIVDGNIHGWVDGKRFLPVLRSATKRNLKFYDIPLIFNPVDRVVEVYTTGTRTMRPVLTIVNRGLPNEDGTPPVPDLATVSALIVDSIGGEAAYARGVEALIQAGALEYMSTNEMQYYTLVPKPNLVNEYIKRRCEIVSKLRTPEEKAERVSRFLDLYSEFDPVALLSPATALMPFPETCQGPRVSYQAGMVAQSLGLYHDSYYARDDTVIKRVAGTRPTAETRVARPIGLNRAPTGRMLIVAYLPLADNGEDGIVANADTFKRAHVTRYSTHKIMVKTPPPEVLKGGSASPGTIYETLCRPPDASESAKSGARYSLYSAIDDSGLPRIGSFVAKGGCLLGKTRTTIALDGAVTTSDSSVFAGVGDEGVVDRVSVVAAPCERPDGSISQLIVRVRMRQTRPVMVGDKFASRYSQKGTIGAERSSVAPPKHSDTAAGSESRLDAIAGGTDAGGRVALSNRLLAEGAEPDTAEDAELAIGTIRIASDLPRIATGPNKGVVPDLIINPASMPSRMTIGKLFEMIASKVALYTGERFDVTAFRTFTHDKIEELYAKLIEVGEGEGGYETMEHSDGTPFREGVRVFVAPCYYQFLRHTVLDKIQYRSEGCVMQLTHQPVGGRAREGGVRQGEMEKAAMVSWGASSLVSERMMLVSDLYPYEVCSVCGKAASTNASTGIRTCRVCGPGRGNIVVVDTCYVHLLIARMVSCFCVDASLSGLQKPYRYPDF